MIAEELLARAYEDAKKPWFAYEIRKGKTKQFNVSLGVIRELLKNKS